MDVTLELYYLYSIVDFFDQRVVICDVQEIKILIVNVKIIFLSVSEWKKKYRKRVVSVVFLVEWNWFFSPWVLCALELQLGMKYWDMFLLGFVGLEDSSDRQKGGAQNALVVGPSIQSKAP